MICRTDIRTPLQPDADRLNATSIIPLFKAFYVHYSVRKVYG